MHHTFNLKITGGKSNDYKKVYLIDSVIDNVYHV